MSRILTRHGQAPPSPASNTGRTRTAWIRRLRSGAGRVADLFPFTPLGLLVTGSAALELLFIAVPRTDLVLLVIGAVAAGMGALALTLTTLASAGLWLALRRRKSPEPLRLECGFAAKTGFSAPSLGWLPIVKVSWSWTSPEGSVEIARGGGRLHEIVTPVRRGQDARVERRIEVSDAFHLTKIAFRASEERPVRALPFAGGLKKLALSQSLASGDDVPYPIEQAQGGPADIRRYVSGDPVRFILWKVFAKSRQLVVRAPEQAMSPARRTVAYLVAGHGDEPAAGVLRAAIEAGALGTSWVVGADGTSDTATSRAEALDVLAQSGRCSPEQGGAGLASFLKRHGEGGSTRIVVFAPAAPGPWLARATAAARAGAQVGRGAPRVEFVVSMDGIARRARASRLSRVLFHDTRSEITGAYGSPAEPVGVGQVLRALGAARTEVLLADRRAGRVFDRGQQRALLASIAAADEHRNVALGRGPGQLTAKTASGEAPQP